MFIPGYSDASSRERRSPSAGEDGIRVNPVYVDDAVARNHRALESPESLTLNVAARTSSRCAS